MENTEDNKPVTDGILPCKICGKQPQALETRSHFILWCKAEDDDDNSFHDIFTWGSSNTEASQNWNRINHTIDQDIKEIIKDIEVKKDTRLSLAADMNSKGERIMSPVDWALNNELNWILLKLKAVVKNATSNTSGMSKLQ